jgi:phosphoribosylanthranilate isomerase
MGLDVKICGVNDTASIMAAAGAGAAYVGFVFFENSPRGLAPDAARNLAGLVPKEIKKVGVFVDAPDDLIREACEKADLDLLQLHGAENPQRVGEIKAMTGRPVIKAMSVETSHDVTAAAGFESVCDYLLFDARPPAESIRPGGNAVPFDWRLLEGGKLTTPWFLSGGLTAGNLKRAVAESGARMVDVSSGIEVSPGVKSERLIEEFLGKAAGL